MEKMVKELLEMLDKGVVITRDVLESAYDEYQLWEVCEEGKEWYSSNVFTSGDLIEEAINNEWISNNEADEISVIDVAELFREHGYNVWRV